VERHDPRGDSYLWVGGSRVEHENIPGSDCNAIQNGAISVTPLGIPWNDEPDSSGLAAFLDLVRSRF
jgi:5'-nucleotidase